MENLGILELGPVFCWYQKLFREVQATERGKLGASETLPSFAGEQGDMSGVFMLYLLGRKLEQLCLSRSLDHFRK